VATSKGRISVSPQPSHHSKNCWRARVCAARVRVADIGGEEFDIAPGGRLVGVGDKGRHKVAAVGQARGLAGFEGRGKMMVGGCHNSFPSINLTHDKDVIMRDMEPSPSSSAQEPQQQV
jgi:hypothetical protein